MNKINVHSAKSSLSSLIHDQMYRSELRGALKRGDLEPKFQDFPVRDHVRGPVKRVNRRRLK